MGGSAVISFADLGVLPGDVYASMGYRGATPDERTCGLVDRMLEEVADVIKPAYLFREYAGSVGERTITVGGVEMDVTRSIAKIMRGACQFVVMVVTAGQAYDDWAHRVKERGDIITEFIADAIGSATAEKTGAYALARIDEALGGARRTSSFTPGQCDWHISDQRKLFSLLGDAPCGVEVNDSFLMHPIKSVSGLIAVGDEVTRDVNPCMLCPKRDCFRRDVEAHMM